MTFEIKPASRQNAVPIIALYSKSGCGKTKSALYLARGLVGQSGKIVMIDTEHGRGEAYAGEVGIGAYDVIQFGEPHSSLRYIEAMQQAYKAGAKVIIIDSISHEWTGIGGVLDQAMENEQKSGKPGLHNWKTPKLNHAKMVGVMCGSPVPVIVCVRAHQKTSQVKGTEEMFKSGAIRQSDIGRNVIVKDKDNSPEQDDKFIYETLLWGEIEPDHTFNVKKWNATDIEKCFPKGIPITTATGEALARWCNAPVQGAPAAQPEAPFSAPTEKPAPAPASTPPGPTVNQMKARLWKLRPNPEMTPAEFEQWLWDEGHLTDAENLSGLTAEGYASVLSRVEARRP